MSEDFKFGKITLRPYQQEAFLSVRNHLRTISRFFKDNDQESKDSLIGAFVEASVGAGKTPLMGAILSRFVDMGWPALCLARDIKLVEQNSRTFFVMRVLNSIYSASFSKRMEYANGGVIVSNEATAYNAISSGAWDSYVPRAVIVDECLTGDTMIETESGFFRIDDPRLKDERILCLDENTGKHYYHNPVRVFSNGVRVVSSITTESGHQINCTDNHRLYTPYGWMESGDIDIGDPIVVLVDGFATLSSVVSKSAQWKEEVFDIEMPTHHNFFANGVLAHNCHQVPVDDPSKTYMQILIELNRRCLEKHGHRIALIGFTGSPYRHTTSIIGDVWRERLYSIDTATLVSMGFLVPTIYGCEVGQTDSLGYNFSEQIKTTENSTADLTKAQMEAMEKEVMSDKPKLQSIIDEVVRLTKDRNAVMITCFGVKHCKEVAKYLPEGSWVIVHSDHPNSKKRNDAALEKIKSRECKYLIQIGCLTTGYDEPLIDTSVILRMIGSLTLLTQLLGRGMRLITDEHKEMGVTKKDHLVLDYSGTMAHMGGLYENPILDELKTREDKKRQLPTIFCPECNTENSQSARRCIGRNKDGSRCEFFFDYVLCVDRKADDGRIISKGCGAKNDPRSKSCRCCGEWMEDPSESLSKKHYTKDDLVKVKSMRFELSKDQKRLVASYHLETGKTAREIFDLTKKEAWSRATWVKFVKDHVSNSKASSDLAKLRVNEKALEYSAFISTPSMITCRTNSKGYDIVARKVFDNDKDNKETAGH